MKMSIYWPPLLAAVFLPAMAHASLPQLNATCPDKIEVHADKGGPVYIDGKEAKLKKVNENYFEAKGSGVTVSISVNRDGSPDVSYTGKHGRNGVCQVGDKTPMEKPHKAESSSSQMVAVADMPRYCAGEASAKFHKRPTEITTKPAVEDGGMYIVYGEFPGSGRDPAVFTCTFTKAGKLVEVDDQ